MERTVPSDATAKDLLRILSDLEHYPDEGLVPYQQFERDEQTYYFTPGGFLYRKDPEIEHLGGVFCGYLTYEVWHYRTDDS